MKQIEGQISLFDLIPKSKFCWDDDTNELVDLLNSICDRYGFTCSKAEFSIWDHVPKFGFHLDYWIQIEYHAETIGETLRKLYEELEPIVEEFKLRDIKVSVMNGATIHYPTSNFVKLPIFTEFKDKRVKIKKAC